MKRLRQLVDRFTAGALLVSVGLGWLLWRIDLEDQRDEKESKAESRLHRLVRTQFWPADGRPGFGPPAPGSLGGSLRFRSYDWLFLLRDWVGGRPPPKEAVIVYMDERSHEELRQALNEPWDRRLHGRLLDRLLSDGVGAVVFDIVFAEQRRFGDPEADQAFARAASAGSNRVVVAVSTKVDPSHPRIPGVVPPYRELRRALNQSARPEIAEWNLYQGLPELAPSYDEIVRIHPPSYPPFKHSLAWCAATLVGAPVTRATNQVERDAAEQAERWLNYYGPANYLPKVSYQDVLQPGAIPAGFFTNRVVFVGSSTLTKFSGERKDAYISPYASLGTDNERFIAGVEIQATAALNLIRGEWLTRMNLRKELLVVLVTGLVVGIGLLRLTALPATGAALAAAGLVVGSAWWGFEHQRVWFAWLIPVWQIGAAWFYAITVNSLRLLLQNRLYQQSLALYLSPKLVAKFARDKDHTFLRPGAEKTELTIFFSDIAGFTSISEGLDSDDLARTMNQYFQTAVGQCIHPTDGTVVKYIGDAIFAFWNAPDLQTDHAERACDAAMRFRQQAIQEVNGHQLITRIGLHTGVANVGNFGSTQRVDYTAIGENINLASRMEGLNKYLGTETLLTGDTEERIRGRYLTRPLGRFVLKGFERAVVVHELVGRAGDPAGQSPRLPLFAAALARFHDRDFAGAEAAWKALAEQFPGDGPTKFYLKVVAGFLREPPGEDWQGEVELAEK